MPELIGYEIGNLVPYVAVNVVIWLGMFVLISALFGDSLLDAVIPGLFGGFFFGVFSWYLKRAADT
ncbi:MAG: hypothetical protein ACI8TL_000860 [Natronomonas sp.]|jgi:hypothetical protein